MVSKQSQKTYNYYLNAYTKWCRNNNYLKENSLELYRQQLKKSKAYVRNCINTISKVYHIPLDTKRIAYKRNALTEEEWVQLNHFCQRTFKSNELSLLLLLVLEVGLNLKTILGLTKLHIEHVIVNHQMANGRLIPERVFYVFEYINSISYQKKPHDLIFLKTYHSYLYAFKKRQHDLFPNKPHVSFNGLKRKLKK